MAKFIDAYKKTTINEGADEYSKHPNDPGGETYSGISRRHWPQWPGWSVIDTVNPQPGDRVLSFPDIAQLKRLQELTQDFYKKNFWDRIHGDVIDSQPIAFKLFDQIVNLGPRAPIQYFQNALNALNRGGELWPDIDCDGKIGPITIAAANICEKI